ncbi:unnamed protein product, partial [Protopolystoma xenopodis]
MLLGAVAPAKGESNRERIPPTIVSTEAIRRRLVRKGERVELVCKMAGYPDPVLTWRWNSRPLIGQTEGGHGGAIGGYGDRMLLESLRKQGIDVNVGGAGEKVDLTILEMSENWQG